MPLNIFDMSNIAASMPVITTMPKRVPSGIDTTSTKTNNSLNAFLNRYIPIYEIIVSAKYILKNQSGK